MVEEQWLHECLGKSAERSLCLNSLALEYNPREKGVKNLEVTRKSLNSSEFICLDLFLHALKMVDQLHAYKESYDFEEQS